VKLFKTREEKRAEAMAREAQAKARKELEKNVVVAEAAIATAELKLKNLTIELEKPQTYADGGRALRLNRDVMATQEEIARLTEAWEKALARVEAAKLAD
jgi:ATP-binding cassette subfamily F protein 3